MSSTSNIIGISVIVCCYNSAQRLPKVLSHLECQQVDLKIPWEIIIINNASTDNTSKVALEIWKEYTPAPLRVVSELQQGLMYARHRGFTEARYEIVSFVDDDNWVASDWVQNLSEIMTNNPEVGACGSLNEPVADVELPWWFEKFHRSYAVGIQEEEPGDVTEKKGVLFGAGLTIRKSAWQSLIENNFQNLTIDRQGNNLSGGGDYELCLALKLAGWRIWYEPSLQLKHYMPVQRLNWTYLRLLLRQGGQSTLGLDPYYYLIYNKNPVFNDKKWIPELIKTIKYLINHFPKLLQILTINDLEGDPEVLKIERNIGRLQGLIKLQDKYDLMFKNLENAKWIK